MPRPPNQNTNNKIKMMPEHICKSVTHELTIISRPNNKILAKFQVT